MSRTITADERQYVLDRCEIPRTPRADGFHAFRRATSKFLRKASGLELAAIQLGHKRMTTTDEHYNDRDMDDLKKAADMIESAFGKSFAPRRNEEMNNVACNPNKKGGLLSRLAIAGEGFEPPTSTT
jgi:hypothetical protein